MPSVASAPGRFDWAGHLDIGTNSLSIRCPSIAGNPFARLGTVTINGGSITPITVGLGTALANGDSLTGTGTINGPMAIGIGAYREEFASWGGSRVKGARRAIRAGRPRRRPPGRRQPGQAAPSCRRIRAEACRYPSLPPIGWRQAGRSRSRPSCPAPAGRRPAHPSRLRRAVRQNC